MTDADVRGKKEGLRGLTGFSYEVEKVLGREVEEVHGGKSEIRVVAFPQDQYWSTIPEHREAENAVISRTGGPCWAFGSKFLSHLLSFLKISSV
jgi:hypothetical protein